MRIGVRVIPNAPRTAITGKRGDDIVLRVSAPAVDGRANQAAIRHLAEVFKVPRSAVQLVSGERSRQKTFEIAGLEAGATPDPSSEDRNNG